MISLSNYASLLPAPPPLPCAVPEPQHIPKGTLLEFSHKYKHEFGGPGGHEPPGNRVCRLKAQLKDLGLANAGERAVFARLMGARLENGVVLIAARSRPTRRENEVWWASLCRHPVSECVSCFMKQWHQYVTLRYFSFSRFFVLSFVGE